MTLKMRLGWDETSKNAPELARRAEMAGIKAVTVHGRTRQQFYNGRSDWTAVAAVKAAVAIPVIVNGDIVDAATARAALAQSHADAIMIGRGVYGQPWIAAALDRSLATGQQDRAPGADERLGIALDHFSETLRFYASESGGDALGLKLFRKHLGWYIEQAPWPACAQARRTAKSALCRLDRAIDIETGLTGLWLGHA